MKAKRDGRSHESIWCRGRMRTICGLMILILILAAAGCSLTKEKTNAGASGNTEAQDKEPEMEQNEGCMEMETNPLILGEPPEIADAVCDYYTGLKDKTDFVEGYHNIQVYTKNGKYKDSYIAFVRYDMKIRDIYTEVPGLGTLYVAKGEDGVYRVESKTDDAEIQDYVKTIAAHDDVQALMEQIRTDYPNAVASDAILQEEHEDLKNAYEDSSAGHRQVEKAE